MNTKYLIKESCILIDGKKFKTYGIDAVEGCSAKIQSELVDVSLDKDFVVNLVELLNSAKIELCHFQDVVSDELNK